jgi:hypothetical protein
MVKTEPCPGVLCTSIVPAVRLHDLVRDHECGNSISRYDGLAP